MSLQLSCDLEETDATLLVLYRMSHLGERIVCHCSAPHAIQLWGLCVNNVPAGSSDVLM